MKCRLFLLKHFVLCKLFRVNFDEKMKSYDHVARDVGCFHSTRIFQIALTYITERILCSVTNLRIVTKNNLDLNILSYCGFF